MIFDHPNLKFPSRVSSSSSGSDKILKPEKIEYIAATRESRKDLFDRLLDESEMVDENNHYGSNTLRVISDFNLSPRQAHVGCKCVKIDCLKLYCECFAKGKICNESCICTCCHNTPANEQQIIKARSIVNYRQPGYFEGVPLYVPARKCTCKKSLCRKKYCQCFNAGLKCTEDCECNDCHNEKPQVRIRFDPRMEIEVHG